jgi:hypothetical protein
MLENLEETRTEMSFVTEELIDSLGGVLQRMSNESRGRQREEELDEVEVSCCVDCQTQAKRCTFARFKKVSCNLPERLGSFIKMPDSFI